MATIDRHRDATSELSQKHGGTPVRTLRAVYGNSFAGGFSPNAALSDILVDIDRYSLQQLVADHEAGKLADRIGQHSKAVA